MSFKHHHRILVVSTHAQLRHELADKIKDWGFRAVTANDGEEAYEHIHANQAELVITEMTLGKVSAVGLIEKARQEELVIPFIFLVSAPDRELLKRAMKVPIADFLEMPYQEQQLKAAAKAAMDLMSSVKRLNHQLKEICKFAHLTPAKTREMLTLQRKAVLPLLSQKFPLRRAA